MSTFTPTKWIFRDSQILSHWYHFEAQLVGNNIWKKIGILATAFLAILICIYKNKRLYGGPSVAGDFSYPPPKMVTAETPTSVKATFDHVAGHGLFRFLTCEQVLGMSGSRVIHLPFFLHMGRSCPMLVVISPLTSVSPKCFTPNHCDVITPQSTDKWPTLNFGTF